MAGIEIKIGDLRMRTPLMAVSGIFGIDYHTLSPELPGVGAVVTKSVTVEPRTGNPVPKIVPTPGGLLNSIGLENPGIYRFISENIPKLRVLEVPIIASVAGRNIEEYVKCSSLLAPRIEIDAIELNVSCPNVDNGGLEFGCDPKSLYRLVVKVRQSIGSKTLIVKLTPNVTDIALPAKAAIDAGADAISLINTLRGMAIDLITWKPKLGNRVGGLSGEVIHPVATYMVYRCYTSCCRENNIPIIGMGGVSSGEAALELILAGATSVGIGTAMFRDQYDSERSKNSLFQKIEQYLREYIGRENITSLNITSLSDLVGKATEI